MQMQMQMNARLFFITTITAHRQPIFRREGAANLLIETLAHYRDQRKYLLHEFVIMPDHLHALLTPADDLSLERSLQFIKGGFSFRLKFRGPVWQASFSNHRIRDLEDYENHREYIRMNPVRARLAERHIALRLTDTARANLVRTGYDPHYGARPLKRAIQKKIETPLGRLLLKGAIRDGQTVMVDAEDIAGELSFKPAAAAARP